ncbi:hypothetical protein WJX72_001250 [[Myrmecia] bisecta]|uniref:DUF6816 domain-containing protein n=1 Tax=[Myrmecia] bisecta TaxID=41462 RepID=A0AAW1PSR2_9CHLO
MFKQAAGQLLHGVRQQARDLDKGVQKVVEIIFPGPLGTSAGAWNAKLRDQAAADVQRALANWKRQEAAKRRKQGQLAARLADQATVRMPLPAAPWSPKQLYYPKWMFGEWDVRATFVNFQTPLGRKYVPESALQAAESQVSAGGVGSSVTYKQRYFSTLPDTFANNLKVNLGILPNDAVIPDRAFNTKSNTDAFLGYDAVDTVQYDPRTAPGKESVTFKRSGRTGKALPPRRVELFINHLQSEDELAEADASGRLLGADQFLTSEFYRQVLLGVQQVDVTDYEIITCFTREADGHVTGRQRSAVYLQPQDQLYFNALGRAVALYDYDLDMRRAPAPADAVGATACVQTPKDFVQCL